MFGNDGKRRDGNGGWPGDWSGGGWPGGAGGDQPSPGSAADRGEIYNNDGTRTYGSTGYGGSDPRGRVSGAGDLYDNTMHGVDITVNDWVAAGHNFGEFDAFSKSLAALEGQRGTQSGYDQVRSMLDSKGFRYSAGQIDYWKSNEAPPPPPVVGGGAEPDARPLTDQIEDEADVDRDEVTPPGDGLDDTVHVDPEDEETAPEDATTIEAVDQVTKDTVIDRTPQYDEVEEARVLNNFVPDTPENQVKDPVTGQLFANSAAARKAGITNWVYADDHNPPPIVYGDPDRPLPTPGGDDDPNDGTFEATTKPWAPGDPNAPPPIKMPVAGGSNASAEEIRKQEEAITIFSKANGGG